MRIQYFLIVIVMFLKSLLLEAQSSHDGASVFTDDVIVSMKVRGNLRVEAPAILAIMETQKGQQLNPDVIARDLRKLYDLDYFSKISIYKKPVSGGIELIVEVEEKPSIAEIKFEGNKAFSEKDLSENLQTKKYTIVQESVIKEDLTTIEKKYLEGGYFLARVDYYLKKVSDTEVDLVFTIREGDVIQIADVNIEGNHYFSDGELIQLMMSQPLTFTSKISDSSLFREQSLERDLEFLSYYYRDQGFAKVQVAKPISLLDVDQRHVHLYFSLEEGRQYYVRSIDFSGDLLFSKEELIEALKLKNEELFRYSYLLKDVDLLGAKYGDLGYAFADINPQIRYNEDTEPPTVDINFAITKGDKYFFGKFEITGNSKTRDNVIRRELEVADGGRYHQTKLTESKNQINRLGFFEEVQAIQSRDEEDKNILNYEIRVKEKPTGQLQASLGFQPSQARVENQWFGQGSYKEANQSGYGWQTGISGKWNGGKNYGLNLSFDNPRVNDSYWSFGFTGFLENTVRELTEDVEVEERRVGGSVTVGRKIIELIRGSATYRLSKITTSSDQYIIERLREEGIQSSFILGVSRNSTNNFLDPSEGSVVSLSQNFTGGPLLGGDFEFMESLFDVKYYLPFDHTDNFRTYIKLHGQAAMIYPLRDKPVPHFERYRLGGSNDLRGYGVNSIGPYYNLLQNPMGGRSRVNKGGNKQMFYQFEYFVPLITEAGIKGVLFFDMGRVFDNNESLSFLNMHKDFGFGFRWLTPMAPFRFEWAYPLIDGKPGKGEFVFSLGI